MSPSVLSPQTGAASPGATQHFVNVRRDALDRWHRERVDDHGEAWECRWQNASRTLAHKCVTPGCTETHVSLYCSFNDAADQLVDLLTDERLDHMLVGVGADLAVMPSPDSLEPDTNALFRYYVRVLWATEVLLDDLQQVLRHAFGNVDLRATLSEGAPLDVNTLRGFINHVGKHGAKEPLSLHCWNHHAQLFFQDSDLNATHLAGFSVLTPYSAPIKDTIFDGILVPKLADLVDVLATALRNVDTKINNPAVLAELALSYGTCW